MKVPKIGVGVIIKKHGKILLGKRLNAHGEGTWAFPGGHLEFGESIVDCVQREVLEETGLEVTACKHIAFTNDIFKNEEKHFVTLFVTTEYVSGEPQVCEPNKCERWEWFKWDNLPAPLFLPIQNLIKTTGKPLDL